MLYAPDDRARRVGISSSSSSGGGGGVIAMTYAIPDPGSDRTLTREAGWVLM